MARNKIKRVVHSMVLFSFSVLLVLLLCEGVLRVLYPIADISHFTWFPHVRATLNPMPGVMPGVEGESRFITNSQGIRGVEMSQSDEYRILAIGGSTTECLYLDQEESWPFMVQEIMNRRLRRKAVWVGNVGRSGLTSRDHIVQAKYLLDEKNLGIDAIVLLVGGNDFILRIMRDDQYIEHFMSLPNAERLLIPRAFNLRPGNLKDRRIWQKTAIWRLIERFKNTYFPAEGPEGIIVQDNEGFWYIDARKKRKLSEPKLDTLPDMADGLREYGRNLGEILRIAREHSVRVLFLTQPTMWREDLSPGQEGLLWMGDVKGRYYSVKSMAKGIKMYNNLLMGPCKKEGLECLDVASVLPADTTAFYDDVHFNEGGSRIVAKLLSEYLLETTPLGGGAEKK